MSKHIDKPVLAVDACIFYKDPEDSPEDRHVLLIQRKYDPFKDHWALPGGHVDKDEPLLDAAYRELREETGISKADFISNLQQVYTYGDPGRDPRGWTVSVLHVGVVSKDSKLHADDDAKDARWFPLSELPPLAFDHDKMIKEATSFLTVENVYNKWIEDVHNAINAL